MLLSSQRMLFFSILILGILFAISATSWFTAWVGLELNLLAFVPLISSTHNRFSSEAALKYFLVQALGSALIIFSGPLSSNMSVFSMAALSALLLKLGAAPFYTWFPAIMNGLNWSQSIILMTFQKVSPMFLICHFQDFNNTFALLMSSATLSAIVGAIGGLNQTSLRKILAFSSLTHMGWMLAAISIHEWSWMLYFIFYSIIAASVVVQFNLQQSFFLSQSTMHSTNMPYSSMMNSFNLLSLGGLPPFSGFLPKWILIESLSMTKLYVPLSILIVSSLVTLYYYLRIFISSMFFLSTKTKLSMFNKSNSTTSPMLTVINLILLFVPAIFIFF